MNTPALVGESCYVANAHETLFLPDRIWQLKLRREVPTNVRWLSFVLQSHEYRHFVEVHATGTSGSMKNLPKSALLSLPVRYPEEPEQAQIAEVLATIDSAIRYCEAIVEKLKQVKQGLLNDLLTRGLDANGALRPSYEDAPHLYQESLVGWIPKDWEATQLGAVTAWASGGTPSRAIPSNWTGPVPLLTPKDMKSFEMSDTSERISLKAAKIGSRVMPAETVFIVVRGMILAHSFPVVLASKPMAFNQDVKAVTAGQRLSGRFLAHWFVANSGQFLRKVTEATHGTKKLDMDNLVGMPIGLPPLTEQVAIVEREAALDRQGKDESSYLRQLIALKAGLTDDLLTGRVRVTALLAQ
jgi:type I restriction enzyme S subunit